LGALAIAGSVAVTTSAQGAAVPIHGTPDPSRTPLASRTPHPDRTPGPHGTPHATRTADPDRTPHVSHTPNPNRTPHPHATPRPRPTTSTTTVAGNTGSRPHAAVRRTRARRTPELHRAHRRA